MLKSKNSRNWRINNPSRNKKNPLIFKEKKTLKNQPSRARRKNKMSKIPMRSLRPNKNLSKKSKRKKSTKK